jgi:hypothetical protein
VGQDSPTIEEGYYMEKTTANSATTSEGLVERCKGKTWQQVRDEGLLAPLLKATGFGHRRLAKLMGWPRSQSFRNACQAEVGKPEQRHDPIFPVKLENLPDEAQVTRLQSELANDIYQYLRSHPNERYSLDDLSDKFDRGHKSVQSALDEIRAANYQIGEDAEGSTRSIRLERHAPSFSGQKIFTEWGDTKLKLGYVSDTHLGNRCACTDELEAMYDLFASEGVTDVLHSGDLNDGPGCRGFRGHSHEVYDECQTATQLAQYVIANYPYRPTIKTHFIESSKSHDGWELSSSGFSIGRSIAEGFSYNVQGPAGLEVVRQDGRSDMKFLGYDDVTMLVGPENKTSIQIHHPDGGSAYALSYQPQKWVESLEGGTKPDIGLLGHYHKLNWIRARNVHVITGECMCWQTPFMKRKRIAAHVGGFILEMSLDGDGTVREFVPREFPFYFGEKRVFYLNAS